MRAFWSSESPVGAVTFAGSPSSCFVGSALQTVHHPCKKTKDQAELAAVRSGSQTSPNASLDKHQVSCL